MKLTRIKLNQLSKAELNDREMDSLLGGVCYTCACGCSVAGTYANGEANAAYGYKYTKGWQEGDNDMCFCADTTNNPPSCTANSDEGYKL